MNLHVWVGTILLHRPSAAKDHAATTVGKNRRPDVRCAWIQTDCLLGNPCLNHGRSHAIGRPRFLPTWLDHKSDAKGDDWQPEGMNARGITRQHKT